jgi:hypothetical protein
MKSFISFSKQNLNESTTKDRMVVFSFARMNPPHVGHEQLVKTVQFLANKHKAHHIIVLSDTHDNDKNPLDGNTKLRHVRRMFPNTNFELATRQAPSFFSQVKELNKKYNVLAMVAGEDRIPAYRKALLKYNGRDFKYKKIDVVSSGIRNPYAVGVKGVSSTKQRGYVKKNDYQGFSKALPMYMKDSHKKELFRDVKKNYGSE